MHTLTRYFARVAISALVIGASVAASPAPASPIVLQEGNGQFTTMGGADPLATDRTIAHWHGQFTDPNNGVTYGYNMVGNEDPRNATAGTTTIGVDIIPLDMHFANGVTLNGADKVAATLASPIFSANDYSTTPVACCTTTNGIDYQLAAGGPLSSGNNAEQYESAVMRSQFNKTGSNYHLNFAAPVIWPTVRIDVPANQGVAGAFFRGVTQGRADITWFSSKVQNLLGSLHLDSTRLPIFLTDNVMLYFSNDPNACCVIGYHGASKAAGNGLGNPNSNGNASVQTFIYAAYSRPGTFNPGRGSRFIKDIHALSHEIAEWGDDPFVDNTVEPWLTPTAPQYGCTGVMETGDPVVGIGFGLAGNPDASNSYADGYWHPEDEVLLPWFAREHPNLTAQLTQSGNGGRYSFMGDLNPYPGFRQPATGC